ncbi:response regulator [Alicyclobacillus sp. ALC3]|uniref:response regulator n=1 Tax=Alicyclobacillus sp. ALC3 TaxID=2796143 RepID=UPI00237992D7|nr:response regulator [Alicyclobacillus sp. ALC3]WDL95311.1 response regulator [Alicyclobacillus sp. ALC3]
MRVLVVGGETSSTDAATSVWHVQRGIEVVAAVGEVFNAFQALETELIDAVVIDMDADPLGGLDLCRFVHRTKPHLFATICSSDDSRENRTIAESCGAQHFLAKPVSDADIRDYVSIYRLRSGARP